MLCFYFNDEDLTLASAEISKSLKLPTYPTPPCFINHHANVESCVNRGVCYLLVCPALMDEDPSGRAGQAGLRTAAVWPCCPNTVMLVFAKSSLSNKYHRDLDYRFTTGFAFSLFKFFHYLVIRLLSGIPGLGGPDESSNLMGSCMWCTDIHSGTHKCT